MKISKKLAFMIICAFGTQIILPCFDAATLKTEVFQILNFVDELYTHDTQEAKKAAKWLQKRMYDDGMKHKFLSDIDIIEIAKTITTDTTIDTKLKIISKKMISEKKRKAAQKKLSLIITAASAVSIGLTLVLLYYASEKDEIIRKNTLDIRDNHITKKILECIQEQKNQA